MKKKQNWVQKSLMFHTDKENEMTVYRLLDRVRYSQSNLIIKLLDDFFQEYDLNENTPYDYFLFVINSYINSSNPDMIAKSQVMNMMAAKKFQSQPMIQTPLPFPYPFPMMMTPQMAPQQQNYSPGSAPSLPLIDKEAVDPVDPENDLTSAGADDNDSFLDSLASGFGSMLDD